MLVNFRKNKLSKLFIINILIILLLHPFAYTQSSKELGMKNNNSKTFNKYQLTDIKPFKPGDGILINTFPDTTSFLNNTFPIDDMGYVNFPIVGKVQVSSMTSGELNSYIATNFQQYIRTPNILIRPLIRISLLGGFIAPGLYYVDSATSIWGAVRLAGGPTLENGIEQMVWERNGEEIVDDLTPYFEKGISLKNLGFKSGDQIITPINPGATMGESVEFVIGLATFATSLYMAYLTYQLQVHLVQSGR